MKISDIMEKNNAARIHVCERGEILGLVSLHDLVYQLKGNLLFDFKD